MNGDTRLVDRGALWTLLSELKIEEPEAVRSFAQALAADHNWPLDYAERVESEYRRFLYLAATSDLEVTPSWVVDRAWHLHLTYSRHYWDVLCREILGRPLHHLPGTGADGEHARYLDQYLKTLELYRMRFGEAPPADVWPRPEARGEDEDEFALSGRGHALVPIGIGSIIVGLLALFAESQAVAALFIVIGVAILIFFVAAKAEAQRQDKKSACGGGCGGGGCGRSTNNETSCGSSCGGGCGGD